VNIISKKLILKVGGGENPPPATASVEGCGGDEGISINIRDNLLSIIFIRYT